MRCDTTSNLINDQGCHHASLLFYVKKVNRGQEKQGKLEMRNSYLHLVYGRKAARCARASSLCAEMDYTQLILNIYLSNVS